MKRREFIKSVCLTGVALSTVSACKSTSVGFQPLKQNGRLLVPKTAFAKTSILNVAYQNSLIGLAKFNENEYTASLLNCTHMGCKVESNDKGFICPCHGARFDKKGQVTKGPATKNLATFETSVSAEFIAIHTL